MKKFFTVVFILFNTLYSQQYSLSGFVSDAITNEALSFANIHLANTYRGTSANTEGEFELKLPKGNYQLIVSYIGYVSDTISVDLTRDLKFSISLSPVGVDLPEVTVFAGANPANQIILNAIETKRARKEKLLDYNFNAFTKTIVKTTRDLSRKRDNEFSLTELDTGQLKITAILENESEGFFRKPDYYKDIIHARKQTENLPPMANIIAGGRVLVDFYGEEVELVQSPLVGPIADDALDYYYYIIKDTIAIDNQNVFKIYFEPIDTTDPGLRGELFIRDQSFDLMKVDAGITEAANPMSIFNKFNVLQQYVQFGEDIFLPVDYRLNVEGNFLGIAKFGFELSSVFNNYNINTGLSADFFDYAIVTVKPDADQKDSLYWSAIQTIPGTKDENAAYKRIDSLEAQPVSFWENFSVFSSDIRPIEDVSISGLFDLYDFNRVEGHKLHFGARWNNLFNRRLFLSGDISHGFSDRKFKKEFSSRLLLGEYRIHEIQLSAYDRVNVLFGESEHYGDFMSAMLSLLTKYDFRDYYYSKGYDFKISSGVLPFLNLSVGYNYREDRTAFKNTDFSFLKSNEKYRDNKQILPATTSAFSAGFELDFRQYVENGYQRIRMSQGKDYFILNGNIFLSNDWLAESEYDFEIYRLGLYGEIKTFRSAEFRYEIKGIYSEGSVPYHYMFALPGNINSLGLEFSFRTLGVGDVFGDRVVTIGIEHDFRDELFRTLDVPLFREWGLTFGIHANAAWVNISNESKQIIPVSYTTYKTPFIEAGFSIGQRDFPMTMEFTWKLNHFGGNNFAWGVNFFEM